MSDGVGVVLARRYRLTGVVGEGGMGTVYSAERLDGGGRVAIKRLHAHLVKEEQIAARFRREALAADAIGHPNIVHVMELGETEDGGLFMALELLEGRDLASEIATSGPLTVGRLVRILSQVCDALLVAHEKGIIHRDLKPENIFLVERDGDPDFVKLLDFGISKFREAIDGGVTSMTRTGTTLGTPYYMAPEQAQAKKDIDQRVDLYALGVIAFRALTCQHPFDDESYPMLVLKICTEAPPPITRYRDDVPMDFDAVVQKCLAKKREDRYADAAEVKAALAPFADVMHAPRMTTAPATVLSSPKALRRVDSPEAHALTAPAAEPPGGWKSGPGFVAPSDEEEDDQQMQKSVVKHGGSAGMVKWALLGLTITILGLGAVLAMTSTVDGPVTAEADLPEPRPLETRPLVAVASDGIGWSWVNPLPRAMPTWYDVAVAGPGLVAMAGHAGQAARYQADGMFLWPTGTEETLHGIEWYGSREAIVVGNAGTIIVLRLEGDPEVVPSGTNENLRDVVAVSPTEAWIVGDSGTLLRMNAYEVSRVSAGTDADLLDTFVAGDVIWVAGDGGTLLKIDNGVVSRVTSGTDRTLRAVGGCPGGELYAAGEDGKLIRLRDESRWASVAHDSTESYSSIGCDGERVVVTGMRGGVLLASRGETVTLETGTDRALHAVASARGAPTWVVGDGGRLFHVLEDHLRSLTDGPTAPLWDLSDIGGALVAVGEWGRIVRQREEGFRLDAESPTDAALASLTSLGRGRLLAVGDLGALVLIRHDGAQLLTSPTDASYRDVVSDGEAILAVGTSGAILRGAVGAFLPSRVPEAGDLWAVTGKPSDALVVGDDGLVLRVDEERSVRLPCDVDASLRGVMRTEEGSWAVGVGGTIVRLEDGGCVVEARTQEAAPTLNDIGPGVHGRPMAVGNLGVAVERTADGRWERSALAVGRANLRAIHRDERNVYVVGAGGVIVRHILLDGT
jgi:serine/threonine-protein kinase